MVECRLANVRCFHYANYHRAIGWWIKIEKIWGMFFFKFKCEINLTIELYIIMSYGIGNLKIIRTVAPITLPLISFKGRERRINLVAEDDLHSELLSSIFDLVAKD